ncbi:MAG TPA: ATP-dependent zinc metalloprotease FtsH [Steroidobacteraceae bacterium]|nr:ATP-dependent zinc metalloprotease FtsH [Steroidobacteraceae bacterium]
MSKTGATIAYVIAALAALALVVYAWSFMSTTGVEIPYSKFRQLVASGQVEKVTVSSNGHEISGYLKKPMSNGRRWFETTTVPEDIANNLEHHGVEYTGEAQGSIWSGILSWIVPTLLFFGLWVLLFRRAGAQSGGSNGFMAIGKSKARLYVESNTRTTFADVAGSHEAKEELKEVIGFLRNPEQYARLGGRVPKGVLLVGPPGTGKTLLARAVAGEAGVPFLSISGSEFVEMFVGVGAARVRDLFQQARKKAPAIIFIDELDALGRARGASPYGGGNDEKEQTLNQLLVELDGFDPRTRLVLLGATNRPEILDRALLRPGRFDRQILVDRPDKKDRVEIAAVHMRRVRTAPDASADKIASLTVGFTGADIANLVNEAALIATRRGAEAVEMQDFTAASERIIAGLEKRNRVLSPAERKIVAYHEMGHALVGLALPGTDRVHKVSIIPRGMGALGYTIRRPTEDRFLMTREELENKTAVLVGGRAAEQLVFGSVSTGAADDLQKATEIARNMITRFGMAKELGPVSYEGDSREGVPLPPGMGPSNHPYSEVTAQRIDALVQRIVENALERAISILRERREALEQGAHELLEHEILNEDQLLALGAMRTAPRRVEEGAAAHG